MTIPLPLDADLLNSDATGFASETVAGHRTRSVARAWKATMRRGATKSARDFPPRPQIRVRVAGFGRVSEIAGADAPRMPRGRQFQAWLTSKLIGAPALTAPQTKTTATP